MKSLRSVVEDLVLISEDHWSYSTRAGECYEDVEVRRIESGMLLIQHKYGISRLAIDELSESSRQLLFRTSQWQNHLSAAPAQGKITSFVPALAHAEAA